MHEMPGELDNRKQRKRKSSSQVSATGRKNLKSQHTHLPSERSSALKSSRSAERLSRISCECHEAANARRCSGSPEIKSPEGKENQLRTEREVGGCNANSIQEEQASKCAGLEDNSRVLFPDEDSNQILPVEQFFGNLDIVQDFPQRSPATSPAARRKERSRHYYVQDDSDGEEASRGGLQPDDRDGT